VRPRNELGKLSEDVFNLTEEIDAYTNDIMKITSEKKRIETELRELSMPSVRFVVEITPMDKEPGMGHNGCDCVRFLMSANAGEEPGPISRIASGGELSRIMLAMKCVFAERDTVPSLVFDEIDTGVSGIAAQRVAEKLADVSRHKQVLCITHLPQIACLADHHYRISKHEDAERTYTKVELLPEEGRKEELSRLISGIHVTAASMKGAADLLEQARAYKQALTN